MKQKNALVLARELAQKENWGEAYKICKEYLVCEDDDDSWTVLGPEENEELALLKIECVIKTISLQDLFSGEYNDGLMLWNDQCDEIVDILSDAICDLSGHIISAGNENESTKKFERYYSKVSLMAKEHYLLMLDDIIELISYEKEQDSVSNFTSYFYGYNCLCQIIILHFSDVAKILEIKDYKFDKTHYKNAINYQKNKLFDRAVSITNVITQATNDFPYFDNLDVMYMYLKAIFLVGESLPDGDDISARDVRIARLKHKINLICDFLNAIYVIQGQRVSLCMAEKVRESQYNMLLDCVKQIREYESNYNPPSVNREKFSTVPEKKAGGCYVATAVYGSYECPQVWTLRRYRDYTLAETWHGRAFIKTYYAISPTLVKWFGHTEWFKNMWKGKLDRMVAKLQANGVESAPYEDRKWK